MSHGLNIHDGTGMIAKDPALGILMAYGSTVPGAIAGYAPGCRFIKTNGNTIGTVEYVNIGTKASANFVSAGLMAAIPVLFTYGEALPLDAPIFVANDRSYIVQSIVVRPLVAGTDASAVTAHLRRAASGAAVGTGTTLHSGTINLKGTIDVNQVLTLAVLNSITIPAGSAVGLDVTGVTTAARGIISMMLLPA